MATYKIEHVLRHVLSIMYRLRTPIQWPPQKSSNVEIDNSFNPKKNCLYSCKVARGVGAGVGVDVDVVSFHFISIK